MRSAKRAAIFWLAVATIAACATEPALEGAAWRERYPAILDNNRPLKVDRLDLDQYRCAPGVRLECDAATMHHFLCTCRPFPLRR